MSHNSRYVELPRAEKGLVEIHRVPDDRITRILFLGPYDGLETHWSGKKGVPCDGEGRCLESLHKQIPTWKGYAPALRLRPETGGWLKCVFEFTAILAEDLRFHLPLAGQVWDCFKVTHHVKKKEYRGTFVKKQEIPAGVTVFDIYPYVERLYNRKGLRWGRKPPFAPREYVEEIRIEEAEPTPDQAIETTVPIESFKDVREKLEEEKKKFSRPRVNYY